MSSEPVIVARQLGKAYRFYRRPFDRLKQMAWRGKRIYYEEFWALRGVDFEVYRGETVGIVGRNGAGKSTLLQLLCGTVTPTEGECRVRGRVAALLELGAGFNPEFTGRDNVFLAAAVLGLSEAEIRARFDEIAAFADIGEFMDHPVKTYSSGMYARLAFAVAIHVDPEILIVDEILAVGDQAFQRKCLERFYQIRESGCTILFVSHDPYQVKLLCQRALYLAHGQRVAFGPAEEVVDRYTIDLEAASASHRPAAQRSEPTSTSAASSPTPPSEPEPLFRITEVHFEDETGRPLREMESGRDVRVRMRFRMLTKRRPVPVSFVFNLKRHDDFYVCGTTTLMDGLPPIDADGDGEVVIHFPQLALLAGQYKWRVAINDHVGLGVLAEAVGQCTFRVTDRFQAHGLIDLPRRWEFRLPVAPATPPVTAAGVSAGHRGTEA